MKDNYYSFLKGIAIIAVVIIHTGYAGYFPGSSSAFMRQIVTFPVGLFIFISGFFVSDKMKSYSGVIEGARRMLVPYIVWSVLWFLETTLRGTQPVNTWKIVNTLFFGGAFFPLYFLIVMVELKLFTPFLLRRLSKPNYSFGKDWILLITPLTFAVFYVYLYKTHQMPLVQESVFPTWLIFYYLGILYKKKVYCLSNITCVVGVLFGLYLMNLEAAYILKKTDMIVFAASMVKYSSVVFAIFLCTLLMNIHKDMNSNIIVKFGEYSFGIYLLHIPVKKYIIEHSLLRFGLDGPLFQPIVVVLTLFITLLIVYLLNKVLPLKYARVFGLS